MSDQLQETAHVEVPDALRLPLWRSLAEKLLQEGIDYGHVIPMDVFEQGLQEKFGTPGFGFAMASLSRYLRAQNRPLILTQKGQHGAGYSVLPAAGAIGWVEEGMSGIVRHSKEILWVAGNTPRELLNEQEKIRLDRLEAKAAMRLTSIRSSDRKALKAKIEPRQIGS